MKRKLCVLMMLAALVCAACFFSLHSYAYIDEYQFLADYRQITYNDSSGLPSCEINAMTQTSDGYIWIGTYKGLTRFDGTRFVTFGEKEGFTGNSVRVLFEDSKKRLWIGTNDDGVILYNHGKFTVYNTDSGIQSNSIRAIVEDNDGNIICGSSDGLFLISPADEIRKPKDKRASELYVVSLDIDEAGNMYAVSNAGQFYFYDVDRVFWDCSKMGGLGKYELTDVCAIDEKTVLLGTAEDVVIKAFIDIDNKKVSVEKYLTPNRTNTYKIYPDVNDSEKTWVCCQNGIGYFDSGMNFTAVDGLAIKSAVNNMFADYEGNYWISSTAYGVIELTKSVCTDYFFANNLETTPVNAVTEYYGEIYIGTDSGLTIVDVDGNQIHNELTGEIGSARVRSLYVDSSNLLWIATYSDGVFRYNGENSSYSRFSRKNGLIGNKARCFEELASGVMIVGTTDGISFIRDGRVLANTDLAQINSNYMLFPETFVLAVAEDDNGCLFVATDGNGIYAAAKDELIHISSADGLSGDVILRLCPDERGGGMFVGTGAGLDYITDDFQIKNLASFDNSSILDIRITDDSRVWLLTENEIYIINYDEIFGEFTPEVIGKSKGFSSNIASNAWNMITDDGDFWICCSGGINIVKTDISDDEVPFLPESAINSVSVDGEEMGSGKYEAITVDSKSLRVTIDAVVLAFGLDDDILVEYQLKGLEKEPVVEKLSKFRGSPVSYTNLSGGNYTFTIRTTDGKGNYGGTASVQINKEPAVYEEAWFLPLLFLGFAVMGAACTVITFRIVQRVHKKKQLEYRKITMEAVTTIANTIDAKDSYTRGHSVRVAIYSAEIARRMKQSKEFVENIYFMGLLHDIGKIGIPLEILNKKSKLTDEEYAVIKTHSQIGYEILKGFTAIPNAAIGARDHHERYDGKGYPNGLKGDEICLEARIICAADSYDAMASRRAYRDGLPKNLILSEFHKCRGSQFDPMIADIVIKMIEEDYFSTVVEDINAIPDIGDIYHIE